MTRKNELFRGIGGIIARAIFLRESRWPGAADGASTEPVFGGERRRRIASAESVETSAAIEWTYATE